MSEPAATNPAPRHPSPDGREHDEGDRRANRVVVALLIGFAACTLALAALTRVPGERTPDAGVASVGLRIDVNSASARELTLLPGIGPARAEAIVAARDAEAFASLDDLRRVKGIGPRTVLGLREAARAGPAR